MGIELWMAWILTVVLWGLVVATRALNGITEVATGRQGLLPFGRWLRKRIPASRGDFVLNGAAQVVQALGFTLIGAPMSFLALLSTVALTTGWHPPSPPEVPIFVGLAVFVLYILSLVLGFICVLCAYSISKRVRYVRVGEVAQPAR